MAPKPESVPRGIAPLLGAVSLVLAGCLTESLWSWHDPDGVREIETSTHSLAVQDVRTPDGSVDEQIAIAVVSTAPELAPEHVRRLTSKRAAWMRLARRPDVAAARSGVLEHFHATSFDLAVFDGEHLHRNTFDARVRMYGEIDRRELGIEVAAATLPRRLRAAHLRLPRVLEGGLIERMVDGFDSQSWLSVVGDRPEVPGGKQVAVAFLAPDGTELTPANLLDALLGVSTPKPLPDPAQCTLLGRVQQPDGETRWVEIPVPILLEAAAMTLTRNDDRVIFTHDQAWYGRFAIAPIAMAWPTTRLPMRNAAISYRWSDELSNERPFLYTVSSLLTPVTTLVDLILASNVAIAEFLNEMVRALFRPGAPRRGSGR